MTRFHFSRTGLVLLGLLTLGWGFNWPVMKMVLADVPPLTFRGTCLLLGGGGVLLLARVVGQSLYVPRQLWSRLTLLCACNSIGWNVFVIYGISFLPAGRAALLGYTMPLWSMTLSVWLLNDTMTLRRIVALVLGMCGVVVLMGADLARFGSALTGVALMLSAAFFWGLGVVLLKRFALPIPTVSLTGWMMFLGALPVVAGALLFEHAQWRPVGMLAGAGMVYNVLIAFMFCYWAWNRIVLMVPVAVSSLSALATPVVGVLSGMWLLHEPFTWHELVAGIFILGAIALVLLSPEHKAAPTPNEAPLV